MIGITPATHGMSQKWNFCQIGAELAPEQAKLALAVVQVAAKWNLSMALWPGMQIISAPATVVPHLAIIQEISLGFGHLAGTISFAPFLLADCEFSPCKAAGREHTVARQTACRYSVCKNGHGNLHCNCHLCKTLKSKYRGYPRAGMLYPWY